MKIEYINDYQEYWLNQANALCYFFLLRFFRLLSLEFMGGAVWPNRVDWLLGCNVGLKSYKHFERSVLENDAFILILGIFGGVRFVWPKLEGWLKLVWGGWLARREKVGWFIENELFWKLLFASEAGVEFMEFWSPNIFWGGVFWPFWKFLSSYWLSSSIWLSLKEGCSDCWWEAWWSRGILLPDPFSILSWMFLEGVENLGKLYELFSGSLNPY